MDCSRAKRRTESIAVDQVRKARFPNLCDVVSGGWSSINLSNLSSITITLATACSIAHCQISHAGSGPRRERETNGRRRGWVPGDVPDERVRDGVEPVEVAETAWRSKEVSEVVFGLDQGLG